MRKENGFTLIELLIVVVIIGILAAIAIPQFTNTKQKAFDAAAQSDIRNMMTAQEAYFFSTQAYKSVSVSAGEAANLDGVGGDDFQASKNVTVTVTADSSSADGYMVTAKHGSSPNTWCMNSSPTNAKNEIGQIILATDC